MNHATPKRQAQLRQYRRMNKVFLDNHAICFRCGFYVDRAQRQTHHFYGKVHELLCYLPGFRMACAECHQYIESNRKEAISRGWRADERLWNRPSLVIT